MGKITRQELSPGVQSELDKTGDLTQLSTTEKGSLVGAVNEVDINVNDLNSSLSGSLNGKLDSEVLVGGVRTKTAIVFESPLTNEYISPESEVTNSYGANLIQIHPSVSNKANVVDGDVNTSVSVTLSLPAQNEVTLMTWDFGVSELREITGVIQCNNSQGRSSIDISTNGTSWSEYEILSNGPKTTKTINKVCRFIRWRAENTSAGTASYNYQLFELSTNGISVDLFQEGNSVDGDVNTYWLSDTQASPTIAFPMPKQVFSNAVQIYWGEEVEYRPSSALIQLAPFGVDVSNDASWTTVLSIEGTPTSGWVEYLLNNGDVVGFGNVRIKILGHGTSGQTKIHEFMVAPESIIWTHAHVNI